MTGVTARFGRNEMKKYITGAIGHEVKKHLSEGVRDTLAVLEDQHKTKSIRRGGGKPRKGRWMTRSGGLRKTFSVDFTAGDLEGSYGSDSGIARVQELGTKKALGGPIKPRRAKYLHFKTWDGKWVRAKSVTLPPRPTLDHALRRSEKKRDRIMKRAVRRGMEG